MHTDLTQAMGYAAAALVLATFSVRQIVTLRCLAIASNLMFIAYAASAALPPVLILHALLLPLNGVRLWQALQPPRQNAPRDGGESHSLGRITTGGTSRCPVAPRQLHPYG